MKRLIIISIFIIVNYFLFGQDSVVIKGEDITDAYINSVNYQPNGHSNSLVAAQWSYYGVEGIGRSLIGFDLSIIPNYSTVEYARFSLYHDPSSTHIGHSDLGGDNTGLIMRVVEDWQDEEVTWYSQPITTNTNWKLIHPPENEDRDYPNIDVTQIVQDMINHPTVKQGFMIKLLEEDVIYRSLVFASIDHPDTNVRPELYIKYHELVELDTIISIKPDAEKGKDAYINSVKLFPDGEENSLIASVWTHDGEPGVGRFLIDFSLPSLPDQYDVLKAEINLYHNPNSGHIGHSTLGGLNNLVIQRITNEWNENTVFWDNQPQTTNENEVYVNPSNLNDQHYLNIDITEMVKFMVHHPDENFGFLVKLSEEEAMYRSVVFASSDYADSTLWPSIDIYYANYSSTKEINSEKIDCLIYPNPSNGQFILEFNHELKGTYNIKVHNLIGTPVYQGKIDSQVTKFDLTDQPVGIYLIQIETKNQIIVKKIII